MGADSSRRFYRGRPRTFQAPVATESSSSPPKNQRQKNQRKHAARREKRAREEEPHEAEVDQIAAGATASSSSEAPPGASPPTWIMCTGQPGCGKTTLVTTVAQALAKEHGLQLTGFYTEEVLGGAGGSRTGFDIVTIPDGARGVLARKQGLPSSYPKCGAYSVDVASFERLALPVLDAAAAAAADVVVLDEVGRMELHSAAFQTAVRRLVAEPRARVLGALTAPIYGHRVPFCDELAAQPHVTVHKLTQKTRDEVRARVQREVVALVERGK